ncbi:Rne/Rng family ribonuclease [Geomonas sp. Red276]
MSKKMLINALHAEEARVAIVEDGRLVDLDVEIAGSEQIRGNIYRGVVVRVEPGLQAAFVDVGLKKLGFLQMGEIHPENYKWRDDISEDQRHRRPRIQEILRRGQELIVQVEKGERDNKGSALTTYVSLPGRYMVLMPGSDSSGISRKVESESERKKLKEIISEMTIPEGYGYIIRTEAMGRTREELQKDLDSLVALYEGVREKGLSGKGAGLIYQESALFIRTIRDYFSSDIDEVLVDSKDVFKDVRDCLKEIDPQFEKLVKLHQEKRPIFSRYQLEEQIDLIYEKKVPLKSGGSIFIEPTEALVSIDVNSGKSTGEKGVEDTAFKTNLEAAEEAARQLRLRDLGGLIVIDFIDMRERKHNIEVEKTLKSALKADKARVNVSRISEFGLLEMSRQRIRQNIHQASTLECPHCDGRGKVKSVEAMALSFLRKVHAAAAKGTVAEVLGSLPLEVAYYLLNRKRRELSRIESDYDIEVTVKGKPSYLLNQMDLELIKREKIPQEEVPQEKPAAKAAKEEGAVQEGAPAEGRKKKKKKGKGAAEAEAVVEAVTEAVPAAAAAHAEEEERPEQVPVALVVEPEGGERVLTEGEHEEHKKKRRRKRKRGKGGGAEAQAAEQAEVAIDLPEAPAGLFPAEVAPEGASAEAAETAEHPEHGEEHVDEHKKKRRRRRRRGKGGAHEAAAEAAAGEAGGEAAAGEIAPETAPAEVPHEAAAPAAGEAAAEGAAAPKTAKSRRSKKKPAEEGAVTPEVVETTGKAASSVQEVPAADVSEVVEAAVMEEAAGEEPRPDGKGRRSRGKRGGKAAKDVAAAEPAVQGVAGELAPEVVQEVVVQEPANVTASQAPAAKPSRKRGGKGTKAKEGTEPAAAVASAAQAEPAAPKLEPAAAIAEPVPAAEAGEGAGTSKPAGKGKARAPKAAAKAPVAAASKAAGKAPVAAAPKAESEAGKGEAEAAPKAKGGAKRATKSTAAKAQPEPETKAEPQPEAKGEAKAKPAKGAKATGKAKKETAAAPKAGEAGTLPEKEPASKPRSPRKKKGESQE